MVEFNTTLVIPPVHIVCGEADPTGSGLTFTAVAAEVAWHPFPLVMITE